MASLGRCRGECRSRGKQRSKVTLRLSNLLRQLYGNRAGSPHIDAQRAASHRSSGARSGEYMGD